MVRQQIQKKPVIAQRTTLPEMLGVGDDSGMVGYCQMCKFMCAADNVCTLMLQADQ